MTYLDYNQIEKDKWYRVESKIYSMGVTDFYFKFNKIDDQGDIDGYGFNENGELTTGKSTPKWYLQAGFSWLFFPLTIFEQEWLQLESLLNKHIKKYLQL